MDGIVNRLAVAAVLLALLGVAACARPAPRMSAPRSDSVENGKPVIRYLGVRDLVGHPDPWRHSNPPLDIGLPRPPEKAPTEQRIESGLLEAAIRHAIDPHIWKTQDSYIEIRNAILIVHAPIRTVERIRAYLTTLREVALPPWAPRPDPLPARTAPTSQPR